MSVIQISILILTRDHDHDDDDDDETAERVRNLLAQHDWNKLLLLLLLLIGRQVGKCQMENPRY